MAAKRSRKVAFQEEVDIQDKKSKQSEDVADSTQRKSRFKENHSLDSDEEDADKNSDHEGLGDEDLAAQEDSTVMYDGDIKVTPFNLQEEMEEGYFDSKGNYFQKDNSNEVKDSWMDNIDWIKIEEQAELLKGSSSSQAQTSSADMEDEKPLDKLTSYEEIVELLKPGESILKCLKRLGGKQSVSASERWKKKKKTTPQKEAESSSMNETMAEDNKVSLERLTGLADQLLLQGEYSIYDETYEKLQYKIQQIKKAKDPVDIFSDDAPITSTTDATTTGAGSNVVSDEVLWIYRWEDKDDSETHGPFTSTQMAEWKEEGYFKDGVFVKKANNPNAPFYSSKRIDFELYC